MKEIIVSSNAPAAIGPYSHAVAMEGIVFTSGQLGIDPATGKMAEGVAVLSADKTELTVFAVNRDFEADYALELRLLDLDGFTPVEHLELAGFNLKAANGFAASPVRPTAAPLPETDGKTATARLRPLSWNVIRFRKTAP